MPNISYCLNKRITWLHGDVGLHWSLIRANWCFEHNQLMETFTESSQKCVHFSCDAPVLFTTSCDCWSHAFSDRWVVKHMTDSCRYWSDSVRRDLDVNLPLYTLCLSYVISQNLWHFLLLNSHIQMDFAHNKWFIDSFDRTPALDQ